MFPLSGALRAAGYLFLKQYNACACGLSPAVAFLFSENGVVDENTGWAWHL